MHSAKHLIAILLSALLCAPATLAQNPQSQDQQSNSISKDVLIIIQQQHVRFTAQKAIEQMRLQVFDQFGELVYDSGAVNEAEINWPLQNGNGEGLKSGLYAYTLSIKETGVEQARERRGHFIVDRAKDRDGVSDKLWITSRNDNGVGADLTVARDENTTVAGASANSGRSVVRQGESSQRDNGGRKAEKEDQNPADAGKTPSNAAKAEEGVMGTPGNIAKFTSATDVGDSAITEVNGYVGIGTTAPESPLHVHGHRELPRPVPARRSSFATARRPPLPIIGRGTHKTISRAFGGRE